VEIIENMSEDCFPNGNKITPGQFRIDIANTFERFETQYKQQKLFPLRYATGFDSIDHNIGGFYPEELILLTGEHGVGKTAFMCSLACNKILLCTCNHEVILYFSHKDTRIALANRMLAAFSKIPLKDVISGTINDSLWPVLTRAVGMLSEFNIAIVDSSYNIINIENIVTDVLQNNTVRLVIIDDFQFIESVQASVDKSRECELADIALRLKRLAQHAKVPIIIVVPLKKNGCLVFDRIRDTGSQSSWLFESATDKILSIHRSEFYVKENPAHEIAEIIVSKNNTGWTGTAELAFCGPTLRFEELNSIASTALKDLKMIISRELRCSGKNSNSSGSK
jgi:replicative DNA helicase